MSNLQSVLPGGFDANAVEPQANISGEPIPAGAYDVEITDAEVRDLKSGNGTGLNIEFTVIGPTHANRKAWQNLNIRHTNAQAEQIAQSQLSALCRAVGIGVLKDTDQLFGKVLRINLKVRPAKGEYGPSNDVTGYEASGSTAPARAPAPAAGPAASAKAAPPWKKQAA